MRRNILISACLLGVDCTYSGKNNADEALLRLLREDHICLIPVCPEQLGGLTTPRDPAEIDRKSGAIITNKNADVSKHFLQGAKQALKIAKLCNCEEAILKERSPSCGSTFIYDGTFSHTKFPGKGKTAEILEQNGITVFSEDNFPPPHSVFHLE